MGACHRFFACKRACIPNVALALLETHAMTPNQPDPRIFFASERTLLAWVRTGLAIIGLGYVVARFGLFLRMMAHEAGQTATITTNPMSRIIGVAFVVVGAVSVIMASIQHRTFIKDLSTQDLPAHYSRAFGLWVSVAISLLGLALAAYLISVRP
jgi:putative membrane protein